MSALSRTPQNTNFLQPTKFLVSFDRIGTSQYFCQEANIPGVRLSEIPVNTPLMQYYAAGTQLDYNEFDITFIVDEQAQSWQDLYSWFRAIASPEGFEERNKLLDNQNTSSAKTSLRTYSDATLTVLSNLNNPLLRIQFINLFPISLSDISFDTTQSADNIITARASFRYNYFNFVTL